MSEKKTRLRRIIKKPEMNTMRTKLVREIMRAKVRFIAITFVVAIGVMIFIASSMSYRNLKTSYLYTYEKLNFADFRVKSENIPRYIVDRVSDINGVTMITPRVRVDDSFSLPDGKHLVGRVTGLPTQKPIVDDLLLKEGRYFEPGDKMVCIEESHFAEFYDLHPGDTITYLKKGTEYPVEIIGVAGSPEYLVLAGEKGDFSPILSASAMAIVWVPMEDAQWMAGLPQSYNQVLFKVKDPSDMESQMIQAEEIMKYTGITEILTQDQHQGNQMLEMDLEGMKSFALFFPLLFLGIACFSIYILLSRLVYTQRPFIGVMRAMGYARKDILTHYLSFALAIGVLGAVLGVAAGYGLSYFITTVYASTMGVPLVHVEVYWAVLFQGASLALLFCAFAGFVPAARSARLDPSKAMRGETLETQYKKPLLERIIPVMSKIPMFIKVPLRNLSRNRRRTAFTIIGLVFSVMIVLVFLGVLDTSSDAMNRGFNLNNRYDMVAIFMGGRDAALISKIQRIPGVEEVEPTIGTDVRMAWDGDSSDTIVMGVMPETDMRLFFTPERKQVYLTDRHVLLNQYYHLEKGLNTGDTVRITTPYQEESFVVGEFIEEPMGNIVYMTRDDVRELLDYGMTSRGSFYVRTEPGKSVEVRRELEEIPSMATIIDLEEIKREIDNYMSLMYVIVYVMLVFAVLMAFTLTFNTITINILEREREIATIRTIGTEPWKIGAMATTENLILGLVAIVPGCLLGVLVGRYAMSLQNTEYMTLSLVVSTRSYILVSVGIIIILLLCQVPSLRYVQRVELAQATKERGGG
ncbi:MAG: FtsX-like permease family protein [Actinobacteria bacterium]|nr:FtsX-like permease family protein [Actinomycetota bacterium]